MIVESDRSLLPESSVLHNHGSSIYPAIELLSGTSNQNLARGVGQMLGLKVDWPIKDRFSNGQMRVRIANPLGKRDVFIVQSTTTDSDLLELLFILGAARRASAKEITLILPYFGYAQSDRKTTAGEPIIAADIAGILEFQGANRITTVDPHFDQIQATIKSPFDILYGSWSMVPVIKKDLAIEIQNNQLTVVAPDEGAGKRGRKWAKILEADWIGSVSKDRDPETGESASRIDTYLEKINGKTVLVVDDVWCSGKTIYDLLPLLRKANAGDIYVAVSHAFFAGNSLEKLPETGIKKVFTSNTINHRPEVLSHPQTAIVDIAPLLAKAILDIYTGERHTDLFL